MSEDFISGLHDDLVEAMDRYERRRPRGRLTAGGYPQLLRPATLARVAAGATIIVALVLAVARESDVERPALPPPSQPSPAHGALRQGGCAAWKAQIVDEPIPQEIATRFAIFRDPPPRWQAAARLPEIPQARKLYRGPVALRPLLDTGGPTSRPGQRLRVLAIAAAFSTGQPDPDICAPPPDPIEPGICVAAFTSNGKVDGATCHSIDEIEGAHAWFGGGGRTVFGIAPDGAERVIFDTPAGPQSLDISGNVFTGEIPCSGMACYGRYPDNTDTRFAP